MGQGEIIIYQTEDGKTSLDVQLANETVWLTQIQLVDLFDKTKQNISLHIRNIFNEGELVENSVVKEYLITALDGKKYKTKYFNLDVIISVGYRMKSIRGSQFRIWATSTLKNHLIKGYTARLRSFFKTIKENLGVFAKGLEILKNYGVFQLREEIATYIANYSSENDNIGVKTPAFGILILKY